MTDRIRIISHEGMPKCGSFEVRFPDGRPPVISIGMTFPAAGATARQAAQELARAEQDKLR